jgi:ribosome-associated protein
MFRFAPQPGEFQLSFVRSGGPGGQNVNKVATKAVLRWRVADSPSLPAAVKTRFLELHRRRLTRDGELVLSSQRFRDRSRNLADCLDKVRALVQQATIVPRVRKATRPSRASKEARLQGKRHRAVTKSRRRMPSED